MIDRLGRGFGPGQLRLRDGQYVLDFRDGSGRRCRRALSRDRRIAERMRSELIHERDLALAGLSTQAGQERLLADLRDEYMRDLVTRACERHVENVRSALDRLLVAIRVQRVRDLKSHDLVRYRATRLAAGISHRTANLDVDRVRAMMLWCERTGLIAKSPVTYTPRLKETEATKKYRRRALSEEEIGRLLAAAEADDREQLARVNAVKTVEGATKGVQWSLRRRRLRVPQAPLWRALLETGARYGELRQVRWADVDLYHAVMRLRATTTKAGRAREIPLIDGLVAELRELRAHHALVLARPLRPEDLTFLSPEGCALSVPTNNISRTLDRLLDAASIDRLDADGRKIDLHALRHAFASRLVRANVPIAHAQRLLGHASVELTSRAYAHLDTGDLRRAVEQMRPVVVAVRRDAG